jgi:pyruvyltransferase
MSSVIAKALGWLALPATTHQWADDGWKRLGHAARSSSKTDRYPRCARGGDMKVYWAAGSGNGNFGDLLTPLILRRHGVEVEWSEREDAELFGAGSIAELIPPGFTGFVLGTGSMFGDPIEIASARVLALRGALTARVAGLHPPLLADLGLLAPDLLPRWPHRDVALGTVRTGGDPRPPMGIHLDPEAGDPVGLIEAASRCERIVSSSLHGLVLADALGIPNMWDPYPAVDAGAGFKYRDYASAYGERIEPYRWRLADQVQVAAKQAALRAAVAQLVLEAAACAA